MALQELRVLVTGCADQADADETVHARRFGERCAQISSDVSAASWPSSGGSAGGSGQARG